MFDGFSIKRKLNGVAYDADNEKFVDPRAEMSVNKHWYETKRDSKGRKVIVRHNTGKYTGEGRLSAEVTVKHHLKDGKKDEGAAPGKKGTEKADGGRDTAKKAEKKEEAGAQVWN